MSKTFLRRLLRNEELPRSMAKPVYAAIVSTLVSLGVMFIYKSITHGTYSVVPFLLVGILSGLQAYIFSGYVYAHQDERENRALELERVNDELAEANARLKLQNRELDAFAHTVAHDLQAPVSVMLGYSTLMEAEHSNMPADLIDSSLEVMVRQTERLGRIINELLLLSKIMDDRKVDSIPLDMASIVAEAVDRLRDLRADADPVINAPESWPQAIGYAPWVEEVWCNYISNALKYGGAQPVVTLGADYLEDGRMIRFWIQDNGKGLKSAQQATLFQRFARLDQVDTKGHGLGLSIVKRIIERLGGTVGVESSGIEGEGCNFWFTLPASDAAPAKVALTDLADRMPAPWRS